MIPVLLTILLILILFLLIRVGGDVEYSEQGLKVRLRLGPVRMTVYPRRKKEPGKEPEAPSDVLSQQEKKGGGLHPLRSYLSLACQAAGELRQKIRIDRLDLSITFGGANAAAVALAFGGSNAILGMIWPALDQNFLVREHHFQTSVDFERETASVYALAVFSCRVVQLLGFAARYALKLIQMNRTEKDPEPKRKRRSK